MVVYTLQVQIKVLVPPGAFNSQENNSCPPCVPMFCSLV